MVFIGEIVLQVKIAQGAFKRLHATNDKIETWSSIQSILIATANVSKILWPSEKHESRGEQLRMLLSVEKTSLLSDRRFRNHFEHYDERIDSWFNNQSSAVYVDLAMNPSMYTFGVIPSKHHRGYDPISNTLTFRDESLDLGAVLNALEEVGRSCSKYVLT